MICTYILNRNSNHIVHTVEDDRRESHVSYSKETKAVVKGIGIVI